jgi:predicted alpha/beta hydrolase
MITCSDGWRLAAEILAPDQPRAVAVLGHAMFVDRRTLTRRLAPHLQSRGIAVVAFDLRGHGQSGPRAADGGSWGYDDLVENDVPAAVAFARARFPGLPLACVGNSLFGHATLAHLTRHDAPVDRLVMLACNYVHPEWGLRALADKGPLIALMAGITRAVGYLPARRLGQGSDDEAAPYIYDFLRNLRHRDWRARDGFSYAAHRWRVKTSILAVAGAGDRLLAPPDEARTMVTGCPNAQFVVVGKRSGLPFDPGHMHVAMDARCRPVWDQVADFILSDSSARRNSYSESSGTPPRSDSGTG